MMISDDNPQWKHLDFVLLGATLVLVSIGLTAIYSVSHGAGNMSNFYKQVLWFGVGSIAALIVYFLPYRAFHDWAYPVYFVSIVALATVLILGKKVAGSLSWISIAGASFQPSELTKFTTIIALARFLSDRSTDIRTLKDFGIAIGIVLLPVTLIMLQPDTGTALTYLTFIVPMIVLAGFEFYYILIISVPLVFALVGFINLYGLAAIAVASLLVFIGMQRTLWLSIVALGSGVFFGIMTNIYAVRVLKPHQLKRIKTFIDPMSDPQGAGYNALQAKVAIGSGGLFGKGFLQGTQTQLRFIPAQWTDFIFCVIGEEFGFIGCAIVMLTYLILLLRLINIGAMVKNKFALLVIAGIVSIFLGHIVVNIGMTIGLMPVIGIPLPFLSYGGSALLANLLAIAVAMNIYRNRRDLSFS